MRPKSLINNCLRRENHRAVKAEGASKLFHTEHPFPTPHAPTGLEPGTPGLEGTFRPTATAQNPCISYLLGILPTASNRQKP
jgi:hypothetical protein